MNEEPEDIELRTDFDVVIVGGGAAGIMAALQAASGGASVVVLEKNERAGKKILVSGGGKCNITNTDLSLDNYHGNHPRFAQDVLCAFDQWALREWLVEIGVPTVEGEDYGKVWPESMSSKSILLALEEALRSAGAELHTARSVTAIEVGSDGVFAIQTRQDATYTAGAVVLACGGRAAPHLGADDSGLKIAESFNHKLVAQYPGLVGLVVRDEWVYELAGLTCEDADAVLSVDGKELVSARSSLLFTHYGITGPGVFALSREVMPALEGGKKVQVLVNFRADMLDDAEEARRLLNHALGANTKKRAGTVLGTALGRRRLGDALITLAGGDPDKRVRELQKKHRDILEKLIYRCPFDVVGTLGWQRAEVMRGGVDVRKVNPKTMASKLQPGLFICGEMLDIDGDVGGYNFQFAFASGRAAGLAASEYRRSAAPSRHGRL